MQAPGLPPYVGGGIMSQSAGIYLGAARKESPSQRRQALKNSKGHRVHPSIDFDIFENIFKVSRLALDSP